MTAGAGTKTIKIAFDGTAKGLDRATQAARGSLDEVEDAARNAGAGFDKAGEAADGSESSAQGFADTLTGTKDLMDATGEIAKGNYFEGLVMAGQGAADLAGGLATFMIPAIKAASTGMLRNAVSTAKSTASNVRHTAVTKTVTVATKAQAAAQRVLNAAMRANPIGIVITVLVALVAAVTVAYQRSETFRRIVHGAFRLVSAAASAMRRGVGTAINGITGAVGSGATWVKSKVDAIVGFFTGLPGRVRSGISGLGSAIRSPFDSALSGIKSLWNSTVGRVSFSIPDWVPKVGGRGWSFPRMAAGGPARRGQSYLVGERGREIFTPGQDGRITPNGDLGSNIEVNVSLSREWFAEIARVEVKRNGKAIKRAVISGGMRAAPA